MKALLLVTMSVAALAVWVSASAGSPGASAACKPGVQKLDGKTVYRFCGPAKANVTVDGRKYSFKGGRCKVDRKAQLYLVDIGIATKPPARPTAQYFEVRAKKLSDGVSSTGAVSFVVGGRPYTIVPNTVKISGKMTRGTFRGGILGPGARASGSWTCT